MSGPYTLKLKGILAGHHGSVTQIVTSPKFPDKILSSSEDNALFLWKISGEQSHYGRPIARYYGHSGLVSDACLSYSGEYALSGSWDKTIRLWNLETKQTLRNFYGHTGEVMSVTMSPDDRQILSGSRDKSIKFWNNLGMCKITVQDNPHTDIVSCVRYSPNFSKPTIVSCGWDRMVKVWDFSSFANCYLEYNCSDHTDKVNTVSVTPNGDISVSGGKDCKVMLWDLSDGSHLHTFINNESVTALSISPTRSWLAVAIGSTIKVWDINTNELIVELNPSFSHLKKIKPQCLSIAWSTDGTTLFGGYTDKCIRIWRVVYKIFDHFIFLDA